MAPLATIESTALYSPSSRSWWDDAFTRLLLDAVPVAARQVVEVGTGVARTPHSLLPSLPDARYAGFCADPALLAEAKERLAQSRFGPRAELRLFGGALPLADGSADVALSVMSLQHDPRIAETLAEVRRVLVPQGCLVAVEPDNLGQRFYFDGVLEEITDVFHRLTLRARVARQPADIAVGPRLPQLLQGAGLLNIQMVAHAVHGSRVEDAKSFFGRIKRVAHQTAEEAGLPLQSDEVLACEQAIQRALAAGLPKRVGYSCHLVPVFRCLGFAP